MRVEWEVLSGAGHIVNRTGWRELAEGRLQDAGVLLLGGRHSAAYYLAGYAMECGLKACVLAYVERTGAIFIKGNQDFSRKCFTHDLEELVRLCARREELEERLKQNTGFAVRWATAIEWDEGSRYQQKSQQEAETLLEAITHPTDGVLEWIKLSW